MIVYELMKCDVKTNEYDRSTEEIVSGYYEGKEIAKKRGYRRFVINKINYSNGTTVSKTFMSGNRVLSTEEY